MKFSQMSPIIIPALWAKWVQVTLADRRGSSLVTDNEKGTLNMHSGTIPDFL